MRHSDIILVLEKGEIVERGSHGELLAHDGLYAGLLNESISQPRKSDVLSQASHEVVHESHGVAS